MSDLIVIAFPDEITAFSLRAKLASLQREYLIEMEDVVVVTKEDDGAVKLHQVVNLTASGALSGGLWGTLVGLIFMNPLLGAAVGAGTGALAGYWADIGIEDEFMREVGASLKTGGSALCVLVRRMSADKVLDRLASFQQSGTVIQTSLSPEMDEKLKAFIERRNAETTASVVQA